MIKKIKTQPGICIFILLLLINISCTSQNREPYIQLDSGWHFTVIPENLVQNQINEIQTYANNRKHHYILKSNLAKTQPDQKGYILFSNTFYLNDNEISILKDGPPSILLGRVLWTDRTYINGELIGQTGDLHKSTTSNFNITRFYTIPASLLKPGNNTISVYAYGVSELYMADIPLIGKRSDLENKWYWTSFFRVEIHKIIWTVIMLATLYHLFIYYHKRNDSSNLIYALALLSYSVYEINMFLGSIPISGFLTFVISYYLVWNKIILICVFVFVFLIGYFYREILEIPHQGKLVRLFTALLAIVAITICIPWTLSLFFVFRSIVLLLILPTIIILIYWTTKSLQQKKDYSLSLLIGLSLPALFAFIDIFFVFLNLPLDLFLVSLGVPVMLGSILFMMAGRFFKFIYINRQN